MSLRARVLAGMAVVALVLVGLAVAVTRTTEVNLVRQVDQQLVRSAPQFKGEPDGEHADRRPGSSPDYDRPSALYVGRVDPADGSVVTLSTPDTLASTPPAPSVDLAVARSHVGASAFTVGADGSGLRYRSVVRLDERSGDLMIYALPLEDVDATIARLVQLEVLASVVVLGALGLVTSWVLRLGVGPIRAMTATAAAIGEGDLSRRVPDAAPGTEAGDLGVALNRMLGRIEEAFDDRAQADARLRRFVADASHELRTPVTTIRGYAELYRLGGIRSDHELSEAMRRTEQEAIRMGDLVQDLLDLARLDQGRPLERREVDLAQLAADAVADARATEPERPVTLEAPASAPVLGDEHQLRQVLANLLGNARVHTAPGTPIRVRVATGSGSAALEVADEGSGMAPDVARHAFERFYRADPARTRHRGGSGLGLSIVAAVVEAHGGSVELDTGPGRGTTVRVVLPGHRVDADAAAPAVPGGAAAPPVSAPAVLAPAG